MQGIGSGKTLSHLLLQGDRLHQQTPLPTPRRRSHLASHSKGSAGPLSKEWVSPPCQPLATHSPCSAAVTPVLMSPLHAPQDKAGVTAKAPMDTQTFALCWRGGRFPLSVTVTAAVCFLSLEGRGEEKSERQIMQSRFLCVPVVCPGTCRTDSFHHTAVTVLRQRGHPAAPLGAGGADSWQGQGESDVLVTERNSLWNEQLY